MENGRPNAPPGAEIALNTLGFCSLSAGNAIVSNVPSNFYRITTYLYLAGEPHIAPRQRISSLLWPEAQTESANANLRQSLVRIRRLQGDHHFKLMEMNFSLVHLTPSPVAWDLEDFLNACDHYDEQSLLVLCSSYGGDLLADIGASSTEFEDWMQEQRSRLRGQLLAQLSRALDDEEISPETRTVCARKLLTVDPCNERAFQVLMEEAAHNGDMMRLQQLYERCERQLMNEFGVRSSSDTRQLYARLANGGLHPPLRS
ncbi:AfsR/SARP family transcriptional regulator [Nitratireductor basaltis]|uniref:DNA-binding transcriptional activator of the SARP family protein n=1 Tax=Nitratireductor basaltis TaxID=472175 RepID=A0A084U8H3_9HYPH|nr:BTAD domain-containing putative transcriptional regulator [Nitratireductor basaltis]KFB09259.1 DNA-binding transcriptional activator of the SARP family protein [Nitratireductor basaltis]